MQERLKAAKDSEKVLPVLTSFSSTQSQNQNREMFLSDFESNLDSKKCASAKALIKETSFDLTPELPPSAHSSAFLNTDVSKTKVSSCSNNSLPRHNRNSSGSSFKAKHANSFSTVRSKNKLKFFKFSENKKIDLNDSFDFYENQFPKLSKSLGSDSSGSSTPEKYTDMAYLLKNILLFASFNYPQLEQ